jgi:hypothetical protein
MFKDARWDDDDNDDDSITRNPLRMRITYQTQPNLPSSQLFSVCTHLTTREWLD